MTKTPPPKAQAEKEARLAAALRENLKRRKQAGAPKDAAEEQD